MEAIKGVFDSKRALLAFANYTVITVLMFMGKMTVAEWMMATGGNTALYFTAETVKPSMPKGEAPAPAPAKPDPNGEILS